MGRRGERGRRQKEGKRRKQGVIKRDKEDEHKGEEKRERNFYRNL
jgi:hypothetical protein